MTTSTRLDDRARHRLRVLFVARGAWPAAGGTERLLRDLGRGLSGVAEVRIRALRISNEPLTALVDTIEAPPPFEPFVDDQVEVLPLALSRGQRRALGPMHLLNVPVARRFRHTAAARPLAWLSDHVLGSALREDVAWCDVVHVWCDGALASAAVAEAKRQGRRCVISPFAHRGQWGDGPESARVYRRADAVLALLPPEAALYRSLGVDHRRCTVVGAGSSGVVRGGGDELRERLGIWGPLVIFAGVRGPHKGSSLLEEAAPGIARRHHDATVAFIGPGPAVTTSSNPRILDAGRVSEAEMGAWMEAADLLVLPSESETFGLVVLEAWSAGTGVIVSDIEALRHVVEDGGGITVPRNVPALAEAINSLLDDRSQLRALARRGHDRWRQEFLPEAFARRVYAVYTRAE